MVKLMNPTSAKAKSGVIALFCFYGADGAVFAQSSGSGNGSEDFVPGIQYNLNSTASYSDNIVRFSDIDKLENPDINPADYILNVSAGVSYGKRIGRQVLGLSFDAGYRFHDNNKRLDNENFNGVAGLAWKLGARCSGDASASWQRRQILIESIDDLVDNDLDDRSVSFSSQCLVAGKFAATAGVSVQALDNSALFQTRNDRRDVRYNAGIRYILRPESYIGIFAGQGNSKFVNRIDSEADFQKVKSEFLSAEIATKLGSNLSLRGTLGYIKTQDKKFSNLSYSGLSTQLEASYTIANRHTLSLAAGKTASPQENLESAFSESENIAGQIVSSWGTKLSTTLAASYSKRDSRVNQSLFPDASGPNLSDNTFASNATISYDLGNLINLSISGRYSKRNADVSRFEYDEKAIMFSIRIVR